MSLLVLLGGAETGEAVVNVPPVILNYLWRRETGDGDDGQRIASLIPNGSTIDWKVASRRSYEYRVEAVGNNGTSSFSAWVS